MTDGRAGFWERFSEALRWKMLYSLRPDLKLHGDVLLAEEEFIRAFEEISDLLVKYADEIRPDVWAYVMTGYGNAITSQRLKGQMWPEQ